MAKTYTMQFGTGDPRTYTGLSPTMLIFVNASSGATISPPAISEALTGSGIYKFTWGTTTPIAFLADAATTSPGSSGRYVTGQIDPVDRMDEVGTSLIALGTSTVAFGSTLIGYGTSTVAFGSTLIGYGVSTLAFGTTSIAIGTTLIGYGVSNIALGTSSVALGTTLIGYGVSALSLGTTNIAIGTSVLWQASLILGAISNEGSTLIGMGNTLAGIGVSLTVSFAGVGSTASSFGTSSADPVDLFGYLKRIQENLEGNSQFTKVSGAWNIQSRGGSLLISKTITNSASMVVKT